MQVSERRNSGLAKGHQVSRLSSRFKIFRVTGSTHKGNSKLVLVWGRPHTKL